MAGIGLIRRPAEVGACLLFALATLVSAGCWAPLTSHGIRASALPDSYRMPCRAGALPLNFATLTIPPQPEYILGPGDVLDVTVHGLYPNGELRPVRVQIMASGEVWLPLVGAVRVAGMNVLQAHQTISGAYADGYIKDPRINVYLAEKAVFPVLVLGEVNQPGVYPLPKYENDVGHAIAAAGGLLSGAATEIEVHRRVDVSANAGPVKPMPLSPSDSSTEPKPGTPSVPEGSSQVESGPEVQQSSYVESSPYAPAAEEKREPMMAPTPAQASALSPIRIVKIPLRGSPSEPVSLEDMILNPGDVVVVPSKEDEVFYVVGRLSPTNFVKFSVGFRDREIGGGFLLPRDRDIDVVTAVAMAGYIDPIESPTTVTVHRVCPDGKPMLIHVDLFKARYDRRETVMVQPGDILYLNPDFPWWFRTQLDRVIPEIFTIPYARFWQKN